MYVYAYAKCTRPLLEGREVINWCNEGTPTVSYLFNENIVGGVSLRKLITEASLTTRDYLDIFVQIMELLYIKLIYVMDLFTMICTMKMF